MLERTGRSELPAVVASLVIAAAVAGCSDEPGSASGSGSGAAASGAAGPGSGAGDPGSGASSSGSSVGGTGSGAGGGQGGAGASATSPSCDPLPPPSGTIVDVAPGDDVAGAVASAPAGATVSFASGTYDLTGATLVVGADGVTLRSASGNRADVVLDGGYDTPAGGLVAVYDRKNVTIAELTIQRPRYHAIHVTASAAASDGVRIHDVHVIDPGEQAIKVNNGGQGFYVDGGELSCSLVELTDAGRAQVMSYESSGSHCYTGGIDAHGAQNWVVRDNTIRGFWCSNPDISEHGIHFWRGSRDTRVERNFLIDNARAIGFGLDNGGRTYDDAPCGGIAESSHYGGLIANNFIAGARPELFASPNGMDTGIALSWSCDATVAHNTVASTDAPFSSIEWRFDGTDVLLVNNLVTHDLVPRDGATSTEAGNIEGAPAGAFVDIPGGDLHLVDGAAGVDQGDAQGPALAPADIDGDDRAAAPDVGADERP